MFEDEEKLINDNSENNEMLVVIYLRACDAIRELENLKEKILKLVESNLSRYGDTWGQCEYATYGITEPKTRSSVDEDAWNNALDDSEELRKLALEYEKARFPFIVNTTQDPRPFIRRRRSNQ